MLFIFCYSAGEDQEVGHEEPEAFHLGRVRQDAGRARHETRRSGESWMGDKHANAYGRFFSS